MLLLTSTAYAERAFTFGLWTQHFDGDHCEGTNNHLVGFEYDGYTFAFFKNSYGNETGFVGYALHTDRVYSDDYWVRGNLYLGALVGYGTEHPLHAGALSPGVYPTFSVGHKQHSLEFGVMPTFWWVGFKMEF